MTDSSSAARPAPAGPPGDDDVPMWERAAEAINAVRTLTAAQQDILDVHQGGLDDLIARDPAAAQTEALRRLYVLRAAMRVVESHQEILDLIFLDVDTMSHDEFAEHMHALEDDRIANKRAAALGDEQTQHNEND